MNLFQRSGSFPRGGALSPLAPLAMSAILVLIMAASVQAATLTVNKTADTNDGVCDADCSLREAVAAANAATSDDVIAFDVTLFTSPQTIVLTAGHLTIADSSVLSIVGPGQSLLSISGNQQSRIFFVEPGARFTASGLTISNGRVLANGNGGALLNQLGTVTLTNVSFIGNSSDSEGGAIYLVTRSLTLNSCTFLNNTARLHGGAISSNTFTEERPVVTVTDSVFEGNSSAEGVGGAIGSSSVLNVNGSRFKNNSARSGGAVSGGRH